MITDRYSKVDLPMTSLTCSFLLKSMQIIYNVTYFKAYMT